MPGMRAMVIAQPGSRFRVEERAVPKPRRHEIRIRVHACGVCHSDSMVVQGHMPGLVYPRIPGHEVIGAIDAIGADIDGWQVGTRVGVGWHSGACGHCGRCRHGNAFACENVQGATGITLRFSQRNRVVSTNEIYQRQPAQNGSGFISSGPLSSPGGG